MSTSLCVYRCCCLTRDCFCPSKKIAFHSCNRAAFCSLQQLSSVTAALWLAADKKGHYTRLDALASPSSGVPSEDSELPFPLATTAKPLAFDYDVLCLLSGSERVASECKELGLKVSPVIDLKASAEYDLLSPDLAEWILHLVWTSRARSLCIVLPSGFWSHTGNSGKKRKDTKGPARESPRLLQSLCKGPMPSHCALSTRVRFPYPPFPF